MLLGIIHGRTLRIALRPPRPRLVSSYVNFGALSPLPILAADQAAEAKAPLFRGV